jgi:endonuclease/exonuclease/phosphatase family metal-dependent hydrolase
MMIFFFAILQIAVAIEISVGSYNIHRQEHLEGLAADFVRLKTVDVLALQEVELQNSSELPPTLGALLESSWRFHCAERVNQNRNGTWESLALISRFPILKCGVLPLAHSGAKKRVALWALVDFSEVDPLLVINTDHETSALLMLGFPDRKKQLESLKQHLSVCAQWLEPGCEGWPTVVLGDFNTSGLSLSSPFASKDELAKTIAFLQTVQLEYTPPCPDQEITFQAFWGYYNLDQLFFKNLRSSCRMSLKTRQGSDHLPVWSTFSLRSTIGQRSTPNQ